MPQTQYNLHLKGFVGSADFDRNYVDYILAKSAILYLFLTNTRLFSMRIALKRKHANLVIVSVLGRSEGDSNSRTAFDGYTLSRRASSATRASLLYRIFGKGSNFFRDLLSLRMNFFLSDILWLTLHPQNEIDDE